MRLPALITLSAAVLPFAAVHLCWALSTSAGQVPTCIPYLDGCTSISATGRHGTAYYVFKALIIPTAVLYLAVWGMVHAWLTQQTARRAVPRSLLICGVIGAVFLVVYATFLGSDGAVYTWLRRFGARMFFAFTSLAQLLLAWELTRLLPGTKTSRVLLGLCAFQLVIGIASLPLEAVLADPDPMQNIVEWWYALAMNAGFVLIGLVFWRRRYALALVRLA